MSVKNTVESLMSSLREVTSGVFKKHESSNAVMFIKASISKIDSIIKTLDRMLKKRNIDVSAYAASAVDKGKNLLEAGKGLVEEVKTKGVLNTIKEKRALLQSKLTDLFKDENETGTSPPETSEEENTQENKEVDQSEKKQSVFSRIFSKSTERAEKRKAEVAEEKKAVQEVSQKEEKSEGWAGKLLGAIGLGSTATATTEEEKAETKDNKTESEGKTEKKQSVFSRIFSKSTERAEKRKAEVAEEKKAVQEAKKKEKEGGGWAGKILKAVGVIATVLGKGIAFLGKGIVALGGTLIKGLGPAILGLGKTVVAGVGKALGWIGGFIVKGLGSFITGIVPAISASIAGILKGGVGAAVGLAGTAVSAVGRTAATVGRTVAPHLATAAKVAGRGALMVMTGPVGWAVAAATVVYGGYRLHKYLTRNNVANDLSGKLTRLRLLMYGFNDVKKDHYHKVFDLEMMMKEYTRFHDNRVVVRTMTEADINNVLNIFNVTKEETEKYQILNTWFVRRFMPAYKVYMQSLFSVNERVFLDSIEKLSPLEVFNFVTRIHVPAVIYNTQAVPTFDDTKVHVTKDEVDQMLTNIINQSKAESKQTDSNQTRQIAEENSRRQQEQARVRAAAPPPPLPPIPVPSPSRSTPQLQDPGEADSPTDARGSSVDVIKPAAMGKLNQAAGALVPGSTSLEGISLNGRMTQDRIHNLDPNVRNLFTGMAREYHSLTGKTIPVNQGFRSREDQAALFARMPDRAARPGRSLHEHGLALDISSITANELDKLGLMRKYGFTRPISGETWHIEPAGIALDPNLARNDLAHRQNAILGSPGRGGGGYGIDRNMPIGRRNVELQRRIFNEASGTPVVARQPTGRVNTETSSVASIVQATTATPNPQLFSVAGSAQFSTIASSAQVSPTASVSQTNAAIARSQPEQSRITGATSPTGGAVNRDTRMAMGADTEGERRDPALESRPSNRTVLATPIIPTATVSRTASLTPREAISKAAKKTGMSEDVMLAYAQMESSLRGGNIRNPNSSATGLFQIVGNTWRALLARHGPKHGIPANATPDNNFYNALMAMEYAKENLARLGNYASAGIDQATAIYLAHHFGASGARRILTTLKQSPDAPMSTAISSAAATANPAAIRNHTVRSYVQSIGNRIASNMGGPPANGRTAIASNRGPIRTIAGETSTTTVAAATAAARPSNTSTTPASSIRASIAPPTPTLANRTPASIAGSSAFADTVRNTNPTLNSGSQANNPVLTDRNNGFQNTVYRHDQSPYRTINTVAPTAAPTPELAPQQSSVMNPRNMEGYMQNQVNLLTQIAGILTSIDGKFNLDKLKQVASGGVKPTPPPTTDKSVPKAGINLTRRSISEV